MSAPEHLEDRLKDWLCSTPQAHLAAQLLIKKAAATGRLPSQLTLSAEDECAQALRVLIPEGRYTARREGGRKLVFRIPEFESDQGLASGSILDSLAKLTGNPLENRRKERNLRRSLLAALLHPFAEIVGLQGEVARRDMTEVQAERGRWWTLAANAAETEVSLEIERYWKLLERIERISIPTEVIRAVHLSRGGSGDTHWFRPGTQPWRWISEDLARHVPDSPQPSDSLQGPEWHQKVLEHCGVCECLTSVRVLIFGNAELVGGKFSWQWPMEAARERMPIWLSMAHLQRATLSANPGVRRVVSIENETTFWDLLEQLEIDGETLLVYTEGHANRAVVQALRQLSGSSPHISFCHQGDLDLPGIRIFHSLCQRTGIPIKAERMDVTTYIQNLPSGIRLRNNELSDIERELAHVRLPLQDLLGKMLQHRIRIEQEALIPE